MNIQSTKKLYDYLKTTPHEKLNQSTIKDILPQSLHTYVDQTFNAAVDSDIFFLSLILFMVWLDSDQKKALTNFMMDYRKIDDMWLALETKIEVAWTLEKHNK